MRGAVTDPKIVFDARGVRHELRARLGRGGQGEVWRTADGRRVVKLVYARGAEEKLRRQLARVHHLDLGDLHVARPIALLRTPEVGYVAEFLGEMAPMSSLVAPPRGADVAGWYTETGGLRRRLRLLAHAGETLSALHARGLVYGDLSPANVCVSERVEHAEAWLIDLDNLRHDSDAESAVYTPGFGAPEVVRGARGATSLSDAWAFAVLSHLTLRLVHPFVGDAVSDGEPELEEEAFAARLPWVEHATDGRNRATTGLPRAMVLSDRLFELARRVFEAEGYPAATRPSVGDWVERLHASADQTLRCGTCRWTFFANVARCTLCERPRGRFILGRVERWEPGHGVPAGDALKPVARFVVSPDERCEITARITQGRGGYGGRAVQGVVAWRERGVFVQPAPGEAWFASDTRKTSQAPAREIPAQGTTLPTDGDGWRVHFGRPDAPHRVATVREVDDAGR